MDPGYKVVQDMTQQKADSLILLMPACLLQVGADINVMASETWQAASLPFVAGLGPRKAQALLQAVQSTEGGYVHDRASLRKDVWKCGDTITRLASLPAWLMSSLRLLH